MDKPEPKTDRELHEAYDNAIDEAYPDLQIAGLNYSTSSALKEVDPTAYRCGFNDWLDGEIKDGIYTDEIGGEYYDAQEWEAYQDSLESEVEL